MNLHEQTYRIKQIMGITESVTSINGNLSIGSKGPDVEQLQKTLKMYTDGKFGSQTKKCLQDFQTKMNIKSDGVFGKETKPFLEKLEKGEVKWETPEFCKTKQGYSQTDSQSDTQDKTNTSTQKSDNSGKSGDLIFMGGLDYRAHDLSTNNQINLVKTSFPNKKVLGFKYNDINGVLSAVEQNPDASVLLFSKGCDYASQIASKMNDKSKMFIVEPYTIKGNFSVSGAITQGVPVQNVLYGKDRGLAYGSYFKDMGARPSGSDTHFGALTTVGQKIG